MYLNKHISDNGLLVLEQYKDFKIIDIKEELSHDGCDDIGFKSDLWDLYITYKNLKDTIIAHWHYENWFCGNNEDLLYEFENEKYI